MESSMMILYISICSTSGRDYIYIYTRLYVKHAYTYLHKYTYVHIYVQIIPRNNNSTFIYKHTQHIHIFIHNQIIILYHMIQANYKITEELIQ